MRRTSWTAYGNLNCYTSIMLEGNHIWQMLPLESALVLLLTFLVLKYLQIVLFVLITSVQ